MIAHTNQPSWLSRHRAWLIFVVVGYGILLVSLRLAGWGSEWISATTAYFVAANLIVLWWYADTTNLLLDSSRRQIAISQDQHEHALRISRITYKPFVVAERVQREDGWFHYYIRNIGPGLAVNVWFVLEMNDGTPSKQSLGALGPNGYRILFGSFEGRLCK